MKNSTILWIGMFLTVVTYIATLDQTKIILHNLGVFLYTHRKILGWIGFWLILNWAIISITFQLEALKSNDDIIYDLYPTYSSDCILHDILFPLGMNVFYIPWLIILLIGKTAILIWNGIRKFNRFIDKY